jgi:outer membrane protein OmpA-like peptidoglycan-associated protein
MRIEFRWVVFSVLFMGGNAGAADCVLGKQYLAQAQQKIAASAADEAADLLRQSIDACPAYDAYEALGELMSKSPNQWDRASAADAFVAAHAKAATPKARAQTLYQYAALLNQEGDPQNAYPLIKKARALDPARADIRTLADTVETQIQHPQQEQITRALRFSFYKPLITAKPSAKVTRGGGPITDNKPADAHTAPAGSGSVNIPINFQFNSIEVDAETRPNIATLAKALADASLEGKRFLFVGHCDPSGDERFNQTLSLRRASAIRQSAFEIAPSLQGRIDVEGHGAREPIDSGTDLRARRANRRLQVIVTTRTEAAPPPAH